VNEIAHGLADFQTLYARDISDAPNPVYYEIISLDIQVFSGSGNVNCQLNIRTEIINQELKINQLRLSMIFNKFGEIWRVTHMHISLPTSAHADDEAFPVKELEDRNKVLQRMVYERTEKLNEAIQEISILANTDKLTGVFNRSKLEDCLTIELHRSERYNNQLCLIIMDIDHFKAVNDQFGHMVGDQVLVAFSSLIGSRIRKTDFLGRWGGEEFLIICPETDMERARLMAETIRGIVEAKPFTANVRLTASFGVASYHAGDRRDSLLSRADEALYMAKRNGRNQVALLDI